MYALHAVLPTYWTVGCHFVGTDTVTARSLPIIIQGGMGVGVSGWVLAARFRFMASSASSPALPSTPCMPAGWPMATRAGTCAAAYASFPFPAVADRVLARWFSASGRRPGGRYPTMPTFAVDTPRDLRELTVVANFAEVWLAKEGHDGVVGINYLEKIQLPTPYAVYGAMLAGVDAVIMGAGIPAGMPAILNALAAGRPVSYRLTVTGAGADDDFSADFDPAEICGSPAPEVARPSSWPSCRRTLSLLSSPRTPPPHPTDLSSRAQLRAATTHPREEPRRLDETGQPIYGQRDEVDLERLAAIGLPFWLAGGFAHPDRVRQALAAGAAGVQVGTAFALCAESGFEPTLKRSIIKAAQSGDAEVFTDPDASPSGYPFKVMRLPGTMDDPAVNEQRRRVCDLGFLREAYLTPEGTVGYRCPSEPVAAYVRKGRPREETEGRLCLCNGLLASVGLGQVRANSVEAPLVTMGDDLVAVVEALEGGQDEWTAAKVIDYLLADG